MGILDLVTSIAEQVGGDRDKANVTGGLMEELEQRSGGVGGLLQSFQNNGLGTVVQQWIGGQTSPTAPSVIDQGLGGTGIIEGIAQRTGLSPTIVKVGLAVAIPVLIHHFVSNGHVTTEGEATGNQPSDMGVTLQSVLSRIL